VLEAKQQGVHTNTIGAINLAALYPTVPREEHDKSVWSYSRTRSGGADTFMEIQKLQLLAVNAIRAYMACLQAAEFGVISYQSAAPHHVVMAGWG
jgi:hypothetical protein